jgi:predicted MFS family arabinose efflux permease
MGTVSNFVGIFTSQFAGFFADRFQKRFKYILMVLMSSGLLFSIWFSLSIYGWGSSNPINLFLSFSLCSILISTTMPIYFEAAVECAYPTAEGTTSGIVALFINIGILFFSVNILE